MRKSAFCSRLLLLAAAPVQAQVTVDLQALDKLPGAKPSARHQGTQKSKPRPTPKATAAAKPQEPPSQQAAEKPATAPPVATASPPPTTSTPQRHRPRCRPHHRTPSPWCRCRHRRQPRNRRHRHHRRRSPTSAASAATTTGAGLRVTFGAGQTDLSPASAAAIKSIVQSAPAGDSTSFNVMAYSAGTPEDPSTARRLSLARALAVRSALMADGVTSSRIYVRALGATGGDEAPDRVDLAVMGGNAAAALPANANAPGAGAKSQSP